MTIIVPVKPVVDPYTKIRLKSDNSGVETQNMKMAMNPFDEIALEEALKLREKNWDTEVVAVSIGEDSAQETLRHALALGADRAILVRTDSNLESLNIAKILEKIVAEEKPKLVLMGKQSIDGDNNQTPQMLAGLLNWPQATYASKLDVQGECIEVTREIDGGLETIRVSPPAIISVDLRLNTPRYASLPNIMKAKQKPLKVMELSELAISIKKHREILKVCAPAVRKGGIKLTSVTELLDKLQHEAKVLE